MERGGRARAPEALSAGLCRLIRTGVVRTTMVDDRPMEFLVDMVTTVPDGTSDDEVADMRKREAARAAELAAHGNLLRLWRPPLAPGEWRTWGLFSADDAASDPGQPSQ